VKLNIRHLGAIIAFVGVIGLTSVKPAAAAPVFVGSFAVYSGPDWHTNPTVFSGQDAAAFLFGGVADEYLISTNSSLDPLSITQTAWYDTWGKSAGTVYGQGFKFDLGNPGYNDPGGVGSAISAFVHDNLSDTETYRNFVWRDLDRIKPPCDTPPVAPEPGSLALLGTGLLPLAGMLKRRLF
jgi:hypothetical protein